MTESITLRDGRQLVYDTYGDPDGASKTSAAGYGSSCDTQSDSTPPQQHLSSSSSHADQSNSTYAINEPPFFHIHDHAIRNSDGTEPISSS
jgi:hypothetical protein